MKRSLPYFSVVIPTCHRNDLLALCLERLGPGRQEGMRLIENTEGARSKAEIDETEVSESGRHSSGWRDNHILANANLQPAACAPADLQLSAFPNSTLFTSYEVVVSDDGQKTTAQSMLKERFPWVRWIQGPRKGPAANRNYGADLASGEWLIFLDDDCLPESRWLSAYADALDINKTTVLEGATWSCGTQERADMVCPENTTGGCLWSCNFGIRRDIMVTMRFDEQFPGPALEDMELYLRLRKAGHEPVFIPAAKVYHPWRIRGGWSYVQLYGKSIAYLMNKHPDQSGKFGITPHLRWTFKSVLKTLPQSIRKFGMVSSFRELQLNLLSAAFGIGRQILR